MHRYLRNLDWILIWTVLLLTGIGMVLIASATHGDALVSGSNRFVQRQGLFLLVDGMCCWQWESFRWITIL